MTSTLKQNTPLAAAHPNAAHPHLVSSPAQRAGSSLAQRDEARLAPRPHLPSALSCGSRSLVSLVSLVSLGCLMCLGCGAERDLSGIWQQAPVSASEGALNEELAWDEGLELLYELHLGRYAERVTGLVVRYQTPSSRYLSPFDRADRCGCDFIYQGSALSDPERLAFGLLDPSTPRALDDAPTCSLSAECERVFKLTLEGDDLVGTTWCEGSEERTLRPVRFVRSVGLTASACEQTGEAPAVRQDLEP
jgi:hypothetical protein